eukprot:scaffold257898_cov31-Tisochrysis_lutea.AAC.2
MAVSSPWPADAALMSMVPESSSSTAFTSPPLSKYSRTMAMSPARAALTMLGGSRGGEPPSIAASVASRGGELAESDNSTSSSSAAAGVPPRASSPSPLLSIIGISAVLAFPVGADSWLCPTQSGFSNLLRSHEPRSWECVETSSVTVEPVDASPMEVEYTLPARTECCNRMQETK